MYIFQTGCVLLQSFSKTLSNEMLGISDGISMSPGDAPSRPSVFATSMSTYSTCETGSFFKVQSIYGVATTETFSMQNVGSNNFIIQKPCKTTKSK